MLITISPNAQAVHESELDVAANNQNASSGNQTASSGNSEADTGVDVESLMREGIVGSPDEPCNPKYRSKSTCISP
jgi:hypothetical protein